MSVRGACGPHGMHHHLRERRHIRLQGHYQTDQRSQNDAMPENIAQDVALVTVLACCRACYNDALRIDHFAHHATGTIGGGHQHWTQAELL